MRGKGRVWIHSHEKMEMAVFSTCGGSQKKKRQKGRKNSKCLGKWSSVPPCTKKGGPYLAGERGEIAVLIGGGVFARVLGKEFSEGIILKNLLSPLDRKKGRKFSDGEREGVDRRKNRIHGKTRFSSDRERFRAEGEPRWQER